jgi:hypothetical protein
MLRLLIETAVELASLCIFGSAIAVWSLVLSPMV